jgi:hypothetical protein
LHSSNLDTDLIQAYRAAVYRIDDRFDLKIDQHSPELKAWLHRHGIESCALITAANPAGRLRSPAFNSQVNGELEALIIEFGHIYCPTVALDPLSQWPPEAGFLIGGIDYADAESLAQRFDQNAWVWSQVDAVPRLRLLR